MIFQSWNVRLNRPLLKHEQTYVNAWGDVFAFQVHCHHNKPLRTVCTIAGWVVGELNEVWNFISNIILKFWQWAVTTRERGVLSSVLDITSFKYHLLSKVLSIFPYNPTSYCTNCVNRNCRAELKKLFFQLWMLISFYPYGQIWCNF